MVQAELTINDLGELQDDLFGGGVAAPAEYADPAGPKPLDEGTYDVRLVKLSPDKDDNGNWRDPRFPALLADFEVAEGEKVGRKANFIKISSRAYPRKKGAVMAMASALGDLVRAYDPAYNWQNQPTQAFKFLLENSARGTVAKIRFGWSAWDQDHFVTNGGPNMAEGSEELKALRKSCSIRGQRNFDADGTVVGPSGKILKAKLVLAQAIPAKG